MNRDRIGSARLGIVFLILAFALFGPACRRGRPTETDFLDLEETTTIEPEPEEKPVTPPPKITEPIYVEIMARTALIWEKYKDAPAEAENAVEALYEKFNIVHSEFQEYRQKLPPAKASALQKDIQEFVQKIAHEYR